MHTFIDEAGTFTSSAKISVVSSVTFSKAGLENFKTCYSQLRSRLPMNDNGEVKSRKMDESQVSSFIHLLEASDAFVETVVFDEAFSPPESVDKHRLGQVELLSKHITSQHEDSLKAEIKSIQDYLTGVTPQLYIQAVALTRLIYKVLWCSNVYFALREPSELGQYDWTIDAKSRDGITPWESCWNTLVKGFVESQTFREPLPEIEGGDYSFQEKFSMKPDDWKYQFIEKRSKQSSFCDLRKILQNISFSSEPQYGLEAADLIANATRRALVGNLQESGWARIPDLMFKRNGPSLNMITLGEESLRVSPRYSNILDCFSDRGKALL